MFNTKRRFLCLMKVLLVIATVFLTAACSTTRMYSGPELPASQTALIRGVDTTINIVSCDGRKFSSNDVIVLPGEHTIEMGFSGDGYYSANNSFLRFKAEAGHTYAVGKDLNSPGRYSAYSPFIMDITTGKRVSTRNYLPQSAIEESLILTERSIEQFPRNATYWKDKGGLLVALKRYEEALPAYDMAISLSSVSAAPWAEKGDVLVRLKRYEEALPALDTAISFNPNLAPAWARKTWALYELKRYKDALIAINKAIQLRPNTPAYLQGRKIITDAMEGRFASREEIETLTR